MRCLYGNTFIEMFSKLSLLLLLFVLFVPRDWLRGISFVVNCCFRSIPNELMVAARDLIEKEYSVRLLELFVITDQNEATATALPR